MSPRNVQDQPVQQIGGSSTDTTRIAETAVVSTGKAQVERFQGRVWMCLQETQVVVNPPRWRAKAEGSIPVCSRTSMLREKLLSLRTQSRLLPLVRLKSGQPRDAERNPIPDRKTLALIF